MHRLRYHKRAVKSLKRIPKARARQVFDAVDALALLSDPTAAPNVKVMRGTWSGAWRLRVGITALSLNCETLEKARKFT